MKPENKSLAQADLAQRYDAVRSATAALAEGLSAEDCALQSMPDASPVKWHLAHTTWYFETFVLEQAAARHEPFHPAFRYLFNSYYNALGEQFSRPHRGLLSRPGLDEIRRYRAHVDERMRSLLAGKPLAVQTLAIVELGLNHEQQHQELILTDVKHLLSLNPLAPAYREGSAAAAMASTPLAFVRHEAGDVEIGHDGIGFAFDNEQPRHRQYVAPFQLADHPVNNAEYLAFVEDGGYRRPEFWLSEGWAMVQAQRWTKPLYWQETSGAWQEFTLQGLQPLVPTRAACHLSHFEADAYAHWADARLPTEFEWEVAAGTLKHGEVWEWTSSSYGPYPGYRPVPGAVGEYNGKFMSNQYVLRGGSSATPASHLRRSYRNFFPSYARWQFSGIRLARD
ncbi:MAG: ergothioneine biosynthesis protein EgtB [Candidatus Parcubacteria bacterium]|nr:ergothioneine biosynthesis protein EgtB [Burkholderiales bacterium]